MFRNSKQTLLEMFADRTTDESTRHNRLVTRETDAGNVALIAYGWIKIAEYDESRDAVTVFTGHKSLRSKTVNTYLNDAVRVSEERGRKVILSGESPQWDTPNDGVRFINNYVSFSANKSPVEQAAVSSVIDDLAHLA